MGTLETFNKDFVFFFLFSSHFFKRDKQHLNHSVDGSLCTEQENMKKKKHTNDREWMDSGAAVRCTREIKSTIEGGLFVSHATEHRRFERHS